MCLLRGTLDTRTGAGALLLVGVVCISSTAVAVLVWVDDGQVTLVNFGTLRDGVLVSWRQDALQLLQLVFGSEVGIWELNVELDEQVTSVRRSEDWHTLLLNDTGSTWGNHLTWDDRELDVVTGNVLERDVTTSQGSQQVNLTLVVQVSILSLELGVWLFVNNENNVTWGNTWLLVTFTGEDDSLAVLHTWINVDLQDLTLSSGLLTLTGGTSVLWIANITSTLTDVTHGLESLNHWAHLSSDKLHTLTVTRATLLNLALFTTTAVTCLTKNSLVQSQLGQSALEQLLQGTADGVLDIFTSGRTSGLATHAAHTTESTTKELAEDVIGSHTAHTTWATTVQALFTIGVVHLSLLVVRENLVSSRELLKLFCCFRQRVLIWVIFQCRFSVSFLQLVVAGAWSDPQKVVELGFLHHPVLCVSFNM